MGDSSPYSFDSLHFPMRARICLRNAGINTVDDLLMRTEHELSKLPNIGRVTVASIVERLASVGLVMCTKQKIAVSKQNAIHPTPGFAWSYLLISENGEIYLGATTNLKARLRAHNSPSNHGWTQGRRWHILGARRFENWVSAFSFELELKKNPHKKIIWKLQCLDRARKIVSRHGYMFDADNWENTHHPSYVKAARKKTV